MFAHPINTSSESLKRIYTSEDLTNKAGKFFDTILFSVDTKKVQDFIQSPEKKALNDDLKGKVLKLY